MEESAFEGTTVLEKLARIDRLDEFMAAVDSADIEKAAALMNSAGIDAVTINVVLKKMSDPFDEP